MSDDAFLEYIRLHRPGAQFIRYVHSDSFENYSQGERFYYVTLYDEDINSSMIESARYGLILIENSYLYSFSYNLLVSWLSARSERVDEDDSVTRSALLKYNFKKFFAEQLLRLKNCVFGRALFLETLLFEEQAMLKAFEKVGRFAELTAIVSDSIQTMSQITRLHELNHRVVRQAGDRWYQFADEYADIARPIDQLALAANAALLEEVRCDAIAIIHEFRQCQSDEQRERSLRSTLFCYATFAVMASLERSAAAMIEVQRADDAVIDLASRERVRAEYQIPLRHHKPFLDRIKVVSMICEALADQANLDLYGDGGPFVLPKTLFQDLFVEVESIVDCDDENSRKMSHLVAMSLHNHPDGFAFLYRISKIHRGKDDPLF